MKILKKPFSEITYLSKKDIAYQSGDPVLRPFFEHEANLEAFETVIEYKKAQNVNRPLLVEVLNEQYANANIDLLPQQKTYLEKLKDENTFTIITAHQPSLFTGTMYYFYKILSVVNLCEQLTERYPNYNFVPLFVNGSEDHDFEEINHCHLYNKTLTWEQPVGGPVGRLSVESLLPVIEEMKSILGEREEVQQLKKMLDEAYEGSEIYNDFTLKFVNALFKELGLITLNMDNPKLKKAAIPILEKELFSGTSFKEVTDTQKKLEDLGIKPQAFAREINLFYLGDGYRERIIAEENGFYVNNTDIKFSKEEIRKELYAHPERFSPNVILRPLYQEFTIPNLAYIGGGGELAYWLERKSQFEAFDIPFPMLIRRNSALIINKNHLKNLEKLGFNMDDIWKKENEIIDQIIRDASNDEISLESEKAGVKSEFESIAHKAKLVDQSLEKFVLAEMAKQTKVLDKIESRIKKAIKSREEITINKAKKVKEKLFPSGGLQERYDNFLPYYVSEGPDFVNQLKTIMDPMDKRFLIVILD